MRWKRNLILLLAVLALTYAPALATDITISAQTLTGFYAQNLPASVTGTVNTSGTAVTWSTGGKFLQQWVSQGYTGFRISINSVDYTVSSVTSTTALTLSSSAGTQTGVSFTVYPFVLLQVFALQSYIPAGSTQIIQAGAPGTGAFYRQVACSVISNTVYIPSVTLAATTDATGPASTTANLSAWFYNTNGSRIKAYDCLEQFRLPSTPTSTTWSAVCQYNRTNYVPLPTTYYTATQVDSLLNGYFTFSAAGLTTNVLPRVSGSTLINSGLTDDGTTLSTSRAAQLNSTASVGSTLTVGTSTTSPGVNNIRYANAFVGANVAAKIQAAIDDLPAGGGIVYANFEGSQSLAALTVNKKLHLILGAGTYTQTGTITVSVPDFILEGQGAHATTIVGPTGGIVVTLSGTMTQLEGHLTFRGINFNGGGSSTRAINLPTTAQLPEGRILVDNCQFRSFTGAALYIGQSNYYTTVRASEFYANVIGIDSYEFADIVVSDTTFYAAAAGTSYYIRTRAQNTKIVDSNFVPGGATGGADIQIIAASANGGYVFIQGNKFGQESENAARYKISIIADNDSYVVPRIHVVDNNFFGVDTQTCMLVDAYTQAITVEQNWFNGFTTIINDSQPAPTTPTILRYGENVFRNNKIIQLTPDTYPMRIFANGGEGWSVVESPESAEQLIPLLRLPRESLQGMVNRVVDTEVSSGWVKNNVTTTDGITDPLGTTRAVQLQRTAGTANTSVQLSLTMTGLKDAYGATSSGRNGVAHVTFWAQKGTVGTPLGYLAATIYNATDGQTVTAHYMELGTGWKRYTFSFIGLDSTKTYKLYFYPGGTGLSAIGGSVNIAFPQMSDYPGTDYLVTSGAYATSTDGARFLSGVSLMKTLAVTGATTLSSTLSVTGNVGLGTTSGSNPLSIKVATDTRLLGLNSSGSFLLKATQDNESTRIPLLLDGSTLTFFANGTDRWGINNSGVFFASTDNSYDIGTAGAFRPRDFHLARNALVGGTLTVGAGTAISKYLSGTGTAGNGGSNISANSCITDTFTVTGAASGDTVIVTPPSTIEASLVWNGFVSAADTIKVQICNPTAGALASADLTWRASVIKH